ncbi:ABC transporter permease [Clostridium estertheticum]|uniref:ABC transporter permease n=1 Tax=Clostridium estertheticum TaxID=238834 RepID=UPI001CF280CD|nr:ABC transporter permease [Clostridium estertheticum]MCB2354190.1 ABC transporter permease [Clostridium estertheticum]WAG43319.1 ABC transporter permease [Clostridium estertheticum]
MNTINILWRSMKWRFQNPISILLTIIQPLIWLVLYSAIAGDSMQNMSGGNYTAFILPGIMVLVILACCSSGGYLNFIAKSKGSFYRILIAPVKRRSIVLGQMLDSVLLSFIEIAIMFILSLFLSVRIASGFTGLVLMLPLIFLTAFFMSGLSYAISLCLPNEVIYETIMNLIVLSVFFTSPALFPMESISGGLKIAVMLNPFTHIINCLRSLILETSIDWQNLLLVTGVFICLCLGSFILALWRLKKETIN